MKLLMEYETLLDKIKNEQEVSSYLDKNVLKYIEKHGLYRKNDD